MEKACTKKLPECDAYAERVCGKEVENEECRGVVVERYREMMRVRLVERRKQMGEEIADEVK